MWLAADIGFALDDEMTDGPVVTVIFSTPAGLLYVQGEPEEQGGTLIVRGVHTHSEAGPGAIGMHNFGVLAQAVMERLGYDELWIYGAVRTTGARPGHTPRPFRFRRRPRP